MFLDIDGTTLTSSRTIHPEALKCLRMIRAKGIPVVLASSRSPRGILPIMQEIGLEGYFIGFSGALIGHYAAGKSDYGFLKYMSISSATFIASEVMKQHIAIGWYSRDRWYVTNKNHESVIREALITGETPIEVCSFSNLKDAPLKLLCLGQENQVRDVKALQGLQNRLPEDCTGEFSKANYLEIMNRDVNKGLAVEKVCEELGIHLDNAMAVGDGENDIEMLRRAGLSVAMGNAGASVKAAANYVTGTNDEGGLGDVLNEFIVQNLG